MSLNFLVRGKGDQPSQPDAEPKALPAIAPPKGQRDRSPAAVPALPAPAAPNPGNSSESKMTDDLHAIAALIGQLTDDPPLRGSQRSTPTATPPAAGTASSANTIPVETGAREDSLIDECQAALARLESAKTSGDSLLAQIEAFSGTLERQAAELNSARTSMT